MDKNKWGVHTSHCCVVHGCKYGEKECPVVQKQAKQEYLCEYCSEDGFDTLEDVENFIELKKQVEEAKESKTENLTVSVKLLDVLLSR